jgi:outer membrane murein-binding lipoprotein Lpp
MVLLIIGLVIGAGGGYLASSSSLQPKITDLQSQVSSLNSEVTTLNAEIDVLEGDKSDLETQVSGLNAEKSSLEDQYETAQATIREKERDVSELQETVANYEDQIEELVAQLKTYNVTPGYRRFSIYRISFEYPEGYSISLSGMLESMVTENSGYVMATSTDASEFYNVAWFYTLIQMDLDEGLDDGIAQIAEYNPKLGSRETSELDGHLMRYQNYSMTSEGVTLYGVFAVAYCTDSNTYLIIQYAQKENPEVFPIFWKFTESIKCH